MIRKEPEEIKNNNDQQQLTFKDKNVVLSVGIPGIGKSTMINVLKQVLKQKGYQQVEHVSSDEIRLQLMQQYLHRNPTHNNE